MKRLKLIYNPGSGDKSFRNNLDGCIQIFQEAGFDVHVYRSMGKGDIERHISSLEEDYYDVIVVCGGDGTINMAVNAILSRGLKGALGIIPSGTANDFAFSLNLPKNHIEAAKVIAAGNLMESDVGLVNGKYFINVCGAGVLTNISQHINEEFKSILGKMAYYLKGIEQAPNFVPIDVRITNSTEVLEEQVYFLLALNGVGAGSFERLAPLSAVNDGLLDFIGVRNMNFLDFPKVFIKILLGEHLGDENILFFQDNYIKIELISPIIDESLLETDIDGELGPELPVTIQLVPRAIKVFYRSIE